MKIHKINTYRHGFGFYYREKQDIQIAFLTTQKKFQLHMPFNWNLSLPSDLG